MNNGRFHIALHILVLLEKAQGELVSSAYLAGSININSAMVRKELVNLRNHGLVVGKEGKNGGNALAQPATEISLGRVYSSVKQHALLGTQKNEPNPKCPVGREINQHLDKLYTDTENKLIAQLDQQTLKDFSNQFK